MSFESLNPDRTPTSRGLVRAFCSFGLALPMWLVAAPVSAQGPVLDEPHSENETYDIQNPFALIPRLPIENQFDFDADNQGDRCDPNDGLIYLFNSGDKNFIEWQAEPGFTTWNVYEGDLAVLRSVGVYTQAPGSTPLAERQSGGSDPWVEDFGGPSPGYVGFHLVAVVSGGMESSLGTNSAGAERPNSAPCP